MSDMPNRPNTVISWAELDRYRRFFFCDQFSLQTVYSLNADSFLLMLVKVVINSLEVVWRVQELVQCIYSSSQGLTLPLSSKLSFFIHWFVLKTTFQKHEFDVILNSVFLVDKL